MRMFKLFSQSGHRVRLAALAGLAFVLVVTVCADMASAIQTANDLLLARIADEVLQEIEQETVPFRPSYDGTKTEPVVLPSRVPPSR